MFSQCVWCEMISGKALCQNQQIWRGRCEIHTAFFRKLTSLTSEGVWARYDRLVTQSLVWVTGEGLNSGGCLLFGWWFLWVDVGSWSQQRHEKRKRQSTLRGFFSITLGKHVHTPLSATRSGHTVWCYSKFRRSTWLMIRNKGFCSFGLHPQHPPPHTHQQQTLQPSVFPPDSTTYISHEESEVY